MVMMGHSEINETMTMMEIMEDRLVKERSYKIIELSWDRQTTEQLLQDRINSGNDNG